MKIYLMALWVAVFSGNFALASGPCDSDGMAPWRSQVCAFAKSHMTHFAWGYEHGIRDYQLAKQLAANDGVTVDDDVLFTAGLLHDVGGFAPYEKAGVDHALRSTQVVRAILEPTGFPMEKLEAVKSAILTHSYYDPTPPKTSEAIVLHDADTLDFMGAISVARLISIAGKEKGFPDPKSSLKLLSKFQKELPSKLYGGAYTKKLGAVRAKEISEFLKLINDETFGAGLPEMQKSAPVTDGGFCCSEACEGQPDYHACYQRCTKSPMGLGC